MAAKASKKVTTVSANNTANNTAAATGGTAASGGGWKPTPESQAKATKLRIISWIVWAVAIGAEAFAIFWVLKQVPVKMWLLIVLIVVAGIFAVAGSLAWKQANRLDPASSQDRVKFFIQNQLGAIITIIAFLPLIIMIFLNKNMDGKQKAVAGGIGIVVLLIAGALGISYDSPSQEQYAAETNIVKNLTGEDIVFWTKSGSVFHVCEAVPDVNKESKDGTIYQGSVAAAHEAGKDRLTKRWESEALNYCGYTEADVAAATADIEVANLDATDPTAETTVEDNVDQNIMDEDSTQEKITEDETVVS